MDLFLCERFNCRMTRAACLARSSVRNQAGNAPTRLRTCAACAQGAAVRTELEAAGALEAAQAATETLRRRRGPAAMRTRKQQNQATATGAAPCPPSPEPAAGAALSPSPAPARPRRIVPYRELLARAAA